MTCRARSCFRGPTLSTTPRAHPPLRPSPSLTSLSRWLLKGSRVRSQHFATEQKLIFFVPRGGRGGELLRRRRVKALRKFVRVAIGCLELRNYSGVFEISAGLNSVAVHRLRRILWRRSKPRSPRGTPRAPLALPGTPTLRRLTSTAAAGAAAPAGSPWQCAPTWRYA